MINLFLNRVFRAIKIDIELFEEVEKDKKATLQAGLVVCLLYTSPSPRDATLSRMPSSA